MIDAIRDTNIIIDLLHELPRADTWFSGQGNSKFGITPTIWGEIIAGALNKKDMQRLLRFLRRFEIVHVTPEDQFTDFYLSHGVEFEDCLIAAVAVRLGVPLYTRNVKHFTPLPALDERQPY
ncbi:MAG: PIN domain-containing protein [Anaerolinea sp.]|nr:PIN domain-containing protein [Anaerolinea sp.]